jgi:CheY-like chemotaxis protein
VPETGKKALEEHPDIILLDLMMPVMDGLEMLAELRRTSKIPVIIVSAYGSSEKVEQARELGIECFLNKPFDVGVLPEVLGVMFSPECTKEAWEG